MFTKLKLTEEQELILKGLDLKKSFDELVERIPRDLPRRKHNRWLEENMGEAAYKRYRLANQLAMRLKEQVGYIEMNEGNFKDWRAFAYPVHAKIVKEGEKYEIKEVPDFKSKDVIFLTYKEGFIQPRNEYQKLLIDALRENLKDNTVGETIILGSEDGPNALFRLTVEKYK